MTLVLNAADVEQLAPIPKLAEAIEAGLREEAAGAAVVPPRLNLTMRDGGFFRVMPALLHQSGLMGFKVFHGGAKMGVRYLIAIYSEESGELLAMMDGHYLTAARTGAATAVATKYLARESGGRVAVIGSGLEGRTNLLGVAAVRKLQSVTVYSPNPQHRAEFARRMSAELDVEVSACPTAQEAVHGADIVVVATNSAGYTDKIAYRGEWNEPGMHINAIGSTAVFLREIDPATFALSDRIVIDAARVQMEEESGDVIAAVKTESFPPAKIVQLQDVVGGRAAGRQNAQQVTLFKSVGTALQDVTAGFVVYQEALRQGRGRDLGEFLSLKRSG